MPDTQPNIEIRINDERKFFYPREGSLLQALKKENIFVPSACGGRGICGLCRVRVTAGAPRDLTEQERTHLGEDEIRNSFRLACQVALGASGGTEGSLRVEIPRSYFEAREFRATVADIRALTSDIREVRLELVNPKNISFKCGQYIQFRIPPYAGHRKILYRAYSIASPPSQDSSIELEIRRVRVGLGTTYIFDHLKKGDAVAFNGPHGEFFLHETGKPLVMIAGGSGMAPMKSMLCHMRDCNLARPVRYFFGARSRADLFYLDLMREFERCLPDFKFIPAVAALQPGEQWEGESGRIDEVVARRMEDNFKGEAYLCGSPAMIDACRNVLAQKGVTDDRIFYDKFA